MIENLIGTVTDRTMTLYTKAWGDYNDFCERGDRDANAPPSVMAWRKSLVEQGYGPNTINSALSAIKSVFKAACAAGDTSIENYSQIRAIASVSTRVLRDRLRPSKDVLTDETVMRIIDGISTGDLKGIRDRAVIALLATTGIRIDELTSLKLSDWSTEQRVLMVQGKTDIRRRAVPISRIAERALTAWLFARDMQSAWMFTSFAGRSLAMQDKAITTQGAYSAIVGAAKNVGVNISPHDFRRYVATRLASDNIVSAQAVLGHASIMTTQRYVKRADLPAVEWLG